MTDKKNLGNWGEEKAEKFLLDKGYFLIDKNWQNKFGEIDLIMLDEEIVVFIEVRTKSNAYYGTAIESIDVRKQKKLILMANVYMNHKKWWEKSYRIDIISIDKNGEKHELNHIINAIEL